MGTSGQEKCHPAGGKNKRRSSVGALERDNYLVVYYPIYSDGSKKDEKTKWTEKGITQ